MLVKKKKKSFEDSICTFWNDFQAHHLKSIKSSFGSFWRFCESSLEPHVTFPCDYDAPWSIRVNRSVIEWPESPRVSGLKLPFIDLVLYRSSNALSHTFTFSISSYYLVLPPDEGGTRHCSFESSPYAYICGARLAQWPDRPGLTTS